MPGSEMIDFTMVALYILRKISAYGVRVAMNDSVAPVVGDLDGQTIYVGKGLLPEQEAFLLLHLFGHTVQWNTDPDAFSLGTLQAPVGEDKLEALAQYERQAARYGLALLHEAGIWCCDQWLADYSACDLAYLTQFYRSGEKPVFAACWKAGASLLDAQPIPPFQASPRGMRSAAGVVV